MKMISILMSYVIISCLTLAFTFAAMAQTEIGGFPIPEGDISKLLLTLATDYKTLGFVGILSISTLLTVQAVKAWVNENWKYKRLLTLSVSIVYSVVAGFLVPGSNAATIIVSVFVSSGGAVALYEALKGAGVIKSKAA